jgi:acyl-CoA synthetase (AMP-forming)/AMP-acid ligase II
MIKAPWPLTRHPRVQTVATLTCSSPCDQVPDTPVCHATQDIEKAVESALADVLRPGCSAAFSRPGPRGEEALVYMAEVKDGKGGGAPAHDPDPDPAVVEAIRRVISTEQAATVADLYLLAPRSIPKTTSGKIAR